MCNNNVQYVLQLQKKVFILFKLQFFFLEIDIIHIYYALLPFAIYAT